MSKNYKQRRAVRILAKTVFDEALRHHQAGRIDDAVARYKRAIVLNPDYADAHNNLGVSLAAGGKIDQAVRHYERALVLNADHADAHNNLSLALLHQAKFEEAAAHGQRALVLRPNYADAHNHLGIALAQQGKFDDAVACFKRALAINPNHFDAHNNLGKAFVEQGEMDQALKHYEQALAISPNHADAQFNRSAIKTFRHGDPDLAALEALAARTDWPADKAPSIHFALAKALDDSGDYVRAFEHMRKGNELKRGQISYDEAALVEGFRRISAAYDRSVFDRFQSEGDPSRVPIFVLGMPRSGSTLIEQILASHPQIHGAGELTDLDMAGGNILNAGVFNADGQLVKYPECVPVLDGDTLRRIGQAYLARLPATPEGKARIVDKLPGNFLNIGLIRLVLPNARIIHTMRDPIDTCLSCYSKLFTYGQDFTYDLEELGRYYRCYSEMMTHWRAVLPQDAMLEVSYEEVVDDLEGQARRLIDYCGLPWDDHCVSFHKTSRTVKTASKVQVRKPLFRSSLQRWRKYEASIGPLLQALGDIVSGHTPGREPLQAGGVADVTGSDRTSSTITELSPAVH